MNAVPKSHTKELSKHENNDAVDTFYNLKCPGNSLKTILRAAGYHMHESDSWKDVFVQGRGMYTLERIQQERPDVWEIISAELVPGLEAWVAVVKSRSGEELPAFERVNRYQALLQWELLAAFLQDSAHHFFEHRTSPVFLDLPVFQNAVFRLAAGRFQAADPAAAAHGPAEDPLPSLKSDGCARVCEP